MKNKTRKLLGRFIALLIILALVLSAFSCAKVPTEDGAVVDSLKTDDTVPPENTPDINAQSNTEAAQNDNNEKTELPEKPKDKAAPCDVTIDEPFSDFEVVVSFTLEESAKDLEYFPEDFSEVDCFNVYPFDYYPEEVHPEYKGRKTVILMLGSQSKQGVLDAVKILEKDDRVYSAEPNYYGAVTSGESSFYISTYKYLHKYEETGTLENYKYAFDIDGVERIKPYKIYKYYVLCEKFDLEILKAFSKDYRVKCLMRPIESLDTLERFWLRMNDETEYTLEDFSYIEGIKEFKLKWEDIKVYELTIENPSYRNLVNTHFALKNDERIKSVESVPADFYKLNSVVH